MSHAHAHQNMWFPSPICAGNSSNTWCKRLCYEVLRPGVRTADSTSFVACGARSLADPAFCTFLGFQRPGPGLLSPLLTPVVARARERRAFHLCANAQILVSRNLDSPELLWRWRVTFYWS